ncbi:MAG: NAD(P)-dependent oxidoreductase, partial [Elusimicrobiota bacterium]|nr:NAD(P)-dependent oxidoreductase [Elusimicrobiota bacterium]
MIPPRIGFIGLGIMGSNMAKNILKEGYNLTVYNRDRLKTSEFCDFGCDRAITPKDLAQKTNIIITMVSDVKAMRDITQGPLGIFEADSPELTLINMSTVSPSYTKELALTCLKKRIKFIDCPVSGSKLQAKEKKLILLAGGDEEEIEKNKKLLLTMGKSVVNAGEHPSGSSLKLCINLIVGQLTSALCESSVLAETLEINPELIFNVLDESAALQCNYFNLKKQNILKKDYPPAFALKNMLKDLRFILEEAKIKKRQLPVTETLEKVMVKSYNTGKGNEDLTIIAETL